MKKTRHVVKKETIEKKIEHDLLRTGIFIAVIILVFIGAGMYFKSLNHFTYQGLAFTKERYGQLPVYHYYYYFTNQAGKIVQYNLYLQHDPRTNNITIQGGPVLFTNKGVYLTIDSSYPSNCNENLAGVFDLNLFLQRNEITPIAGVMNASLRSETKQPYITCVTKANESQVIQLRGGDETKVYIAGNCYDIVIGKDCRIQDAIEKFKVQAIIDAKQSPLLNS